MLVYLQQENYKVLEKVAEESAMRFNMSFVAKILFATALNENGNHAKSIEELRKAGIIAGDNKDMILQVLGMKADVYYRMKDFSKAFETFDEALKYNSNDLVVLNNYAYYLAEQGLKLKEAEEMAKKVVENEKGNYTFLDTYAWVLYKRGKLKEAARIMENIINNTDKPDAEYYEHYGFIMKSRRKCDEAVKSWNMALKLDSSKQQLIKEIEKCEK
jgi:Tfp pilus assembly protein PilF